MNVSTRKIDSRIDKQNHTKPYRYVKKHLGKRREVNGLLAELEDPVDVIETLIEEAQKSRKS